MWSVFRSTDSCQLPRRELLRIGGLSLLGLGSSGLARLHAAQGTQPPPKSVVFLFLFGGPSQIDLWDMKPHAPANIRGEFKPAATAVPGIHVCQHLPRLAAQMDKICLLRSMTHNMNVHGPACSEVYSGREYFTAPVTDQALPDDWPSLSAMTMRYGQHRPGLPCSVVLPWHLQFPGQARRIAGQTGGRMGEQHNAMLIEGDFEKKEFRVDGLKMRKTVPISRIENRRELLGQIQTRSGQNKLYGAVADGFGQHRRRAYSLLKHQAGELLDLKRESEKTRATYGDTMVGQSLLMARRLVESGVSLVTVNWEDETKIDGVNTCWDTHQDNFSKLKTLLCPTFDQAFPAFIEDLDQRGLLESTLVVAIGEFGRTPQMGQFSQSSNTRKTGRDHWPHAFTALLAGGGVQGGQVYGKTNPHGAFVETDPVSPADLSATILNYLGINPRLEYVNEIRDMTHLLSPGKPLEIVG